MGPAGIKVEVECDRLDQVRIAVDAGADVIMLDNMRLADLREAVKLVEWVGRPLADSATAARVLDLPA